MRFCYWRLEFASVVRATAAGLKSALGVGLVKERRNDDEPVPKAMAPVPKGSAEGFGARRRCLSPSAGMSPTRLNLSPTQFDLAPVGRGLSPLSFDLSLVAWAFPLALALLFTSKLWLS